MLIISQYYPPDMGGGATRSENVARGLVKNGCQVTVITAVPHYPMGKIPKQYRWRPFVVEDNDGIRIIRSFVPPLSSKGIARRVILFLTFMISSVFCLFFVGPMDIVWAANPNILSVYPGFIYSRVKSCPLVQNIDDLWPEALYDLGLSKKSVFARIAEIFASIAYNLVDAITPISEGYSNILTAKYHLSKSIISVVPAGVDLGRFSARPKELASSSKKVVLYIGAFSPAYDFDQVFMAASALSAQNDIQFILQGGGETSSLLKLKIQSEDNHNITIVDKIVNRNEVAQILLKADILLLPLSGLRYIELGISSKLYEYQAAGKPIVCCSRGFPAKYVIESNSGLVVNPGDSNALAKAIRKLSEDPSFARQLGSNGRQYVAIELGIEKIGIRMLDLFHKIIDQSSIIER